MTRFLDALVEPALWFAVDWSLRWAVLIGLAALGLLLCRPRRAAVRQLLCGAALIGGLLLPFAPRWGEGWRLAREKLEIPAQEKQAGVPSFPSSAWERPPGSSASHPDSPPARSGASRMSFPSSAWEREEPAEVAERQAAPAEALGNRRLAVLGLALGWALGVLVSLMRRLGGACVLWRMRRESVAVDGPALDVFAACRAELNVRGRVRLAAHPRIHSPILLGVFRPLILVPSNWSELPAGVQRAALLHELAHVRRRDHWLAPLLEIIRVAFFFHPLVRWLLSRLEYERELLCDEMVLGRGVDRGDYARTLLEFARQSGRFALPRLSGSFYLPMSRRRTVKARINHLLEEDMERWMKPLSVRWAVAGGAGLLALMLSLASYRVVAEEPDKTAAPAEKPKEAPSKAPAAVKSKREALRYGGKNFDQWRVELETELKPEIRVDGLTALAAFGANGYGPEAARTVVELMKGYELGSNNKKDNNVVKAAFEAIAKIDESALPILWESLASDNSRVRRFAIHCLKNANRIYPEHVPELLKAARDKDLDVCDTALDLLLLIEDKPKSCVPVLLHCLTDHNIAYVSHVKAMQSLQRMHPDAEQMIPALKEALKDTVGDVRSIAIQMAGSYGAKAKPLVPGLVEALKRTDFKGNIPDFVAIMDAFAALGPAAKDALPRLKELREENIAAKQYFDGKNYSTYYELISHTISKIEGK